MRDKALSTPFDNIGSPSNGDILVYMTTRQTEAVAGLPRLPDLPKLDLSLLSVGEARGKYENG